MLAPFLALPFNRLAGFRLATLFLASFLSGSLLSLSLDTPLFQAEASGFRSVTLTTPSNPYQQLSELERQLYQKAYPHHSIRTRLERLEQSVYGPSFRGLGSSRKRIEALMATFHANRQEQADQNRERTLSFLETRLWGYTNATYSIEERLSQLETALLQKQPASDKSLDERLEALGNLIPVGSKGIRVTLNNEPQGKRADEVFYPSDETLSAESIDANSSGKRQTLSQRLNLPATPRLPGSQAASSSSPSSSATPQSQWRTTLNASQHPNALEEAGTGIDPSINQPNVAHWNYTLKTPAAELPKVFHSKVAPRLPNAPTDTYLYRLSASRDFTYLRWSDLPVRLWSNATTSREHIQLVQWMAPWQQAVPLQIAATPDEAQIWVLFAPLQGLTGVSPRPILTEPHLIEESEKRLRTVALIHAYRQVLGRATQRLMIQQLGHALGAWGFSDRPTDLLYPATQAELNAIPPGLRGEAATGLDSLKQEIKRTWQLDKPAYQQALPSARDIATVKALYSQQQAINMSTWDPVGVLQQPR